MTVKAQTPMVLVEQFFSDGKRLVEVTAVGKDYVTAIDVVSEQEVVIPAREIGHNWYRIFPARAT